MLESLGAIEWLTFVLAIATVGLAYITWLLAREAKLTRQLQTSPHVVITIEPHPAFINFFNVVIENTGKETAFDIHIDPKFNITIKRNTKEIALSTFSLFKLDTLKPGQAISSWLGKWEDLPKSHLEFSLTYRNRDGIKFNDQALCNPQQYTDISNLGGDYQNNVVKNLDKISKSLHDITSGFRRVRIDTYNSRDRKKEQEELEAEWNKLE